jgi:hypothetical protein
MNKWNNDTEFEKYTITKVDGEQSPYVIHFDSGTALGCPSDFTPKVGDIATLFGRGFGYAVRGLIINDREVWYKTPEEQEAADKAWLAEYDRKQALIPKRPPITAFGRTFSHEMSEISGFGGGYETCCRAMVLAGVECLSKNDNAPDDELEAHMLAAEYSHEGTTRRAGDDCTGAMFGCSKSHAKHAHQIGWDAYVAKMTTAQRESHP